MSGEAACIPPLEVGRRLLSRSPVLIWLGAEIVGLEPGYAHLAMTIGDQHTNFIGVGHGGVVFTLADAALGFASSCRNDRVVTADAEIRYLMPAKAGERLEAVAREVWRRPPNALTDVEVRQGGHVLALMRGRVRSLGEPHFTE
ncbi:MAG: hotdog fold thioesterase [Hyphomicrobiaceae bacterium]